jgi:protease-4
MKIHGPKDRLAAVFLFALVSTVALREAGAQSIYERILMPPAGLAASSEPFLIPWNPASMALNSGWEASYFHSEIQSQTFLAGTGDAAYIASPVFGPIYLGFGFENVRPSGEWQEAWGYGVEDPKSWTMLTFALALRLRDFASIGADLRTYVADENPRFDDVTTWDLALHIHPSPYMALNLSVHDISTPYTTLETSAGRIDVAIERTWGVGVAVRPLGRDVLTISVDNLLGQTSKNDILRTFIEIKPVRGLAILGLMELWFGDIAPMRDDRDFEMQASVGLRLDLPNVGIFGAAHMANRKGSPYLGFSVGLTVSGQYYPSLIIPRRFVEIPLEGSLDGEDAVALLEYLEAARKEPSIKGVVLDVRDLEVMPGLARDIIDGIDRIRSIGKIVVCFEDGIGNLASTYVCSHADRFYVGHAGGTMASGMKMRIFYYTGLLHKLGVNAQIFRIGDYKSFPESLTLEGPSDQSTEQHQDVLDDIYGNLTSDIDAGRKLGGAEKAAVVIAQGPYNAKEAVEAKLADAVIWRDELKDNLEKTTGKKIILSKNFSFDRKVPDTWSSGRQVGVVVVSGVITDGKSRKVPLLGFETSGAETLTDVLEKARKNPQIAAVVLRVDSGGGSAIGSDKIWRAVERLAEKKPVVASFGSVAASGGYYVAASATEIFAQPSTVTGSIGIFAGKADVSELMKKIGIGVAVFKKGDRADMEAFYRPYTDDEIEVVKKEINYAYNTFLDRVAKGRGMKKSDLHEIAQGRIWSGLKAKQNGLVDRNGGFLDAVDRARKLAKLPSWAPVVSLTRKPKSILQKLLGSALGVNSKAGEALEVVEEMVEKSGSAKIMSPLILTISSEEPLAMTDGVLEWE